MRPLPRLAAVLTVALALAGCGSPAPPPPLSGGTITSVNEVPQAVSFPTSDGVTLSGRVVGLGATGVVLSNMGDNDPRPWEWFAPQLATPGRTVLTYRYRYSPDAGPFTAETAGDALEDLYAAVTYLRTHGATRIVLIGASLGGVLTALGAAEIQPDAVVIIAAPVEVPGVDVRVREADLAALHGPKLFIASDDDPTVPAAQTRRLYDLAPQPKQWRTFPGTAHGVQLFGTDHVAELSRVLVNFVAGV